MGRILELFKRTLKEWKLYHQHICAVCDKKIEDLDKSYEAVSSWQLIHEDCMKKLFDEIDE